MDAGNWEGSFLHGGQIPWDGFIKTAIVLEQRITMPVMGNGNNRYCCYRMFKPRDDREYNNKYSGQHFVDSCTGPVCARDCGITA
jgi:hypothetical protein